MPVGAYAVASDTGRRRRRNEDNYVVAPPLFAVADGMGGAQAGEVASQLAASALEGGNTDAPDGTQRIDELIQEANRRIFDRASTDPSASGMGTTMTVALVEGMTVAIGHVGDSRAYLVRGEQMEQLTEDHSLVNELLKSGKLSEEEAQVHPQRSVITRAVGTDPDVDVDGFTIEAEDGDVFLICSDGLSDMVEDEEILELLHQDRDDLEQAVKALVAAANRGGGEDNITAVAFRISTEPPPSLEDTVAMPALPDPEDEPDEQTREYAEPDPGGDTMVVPPGEAETEASNTVLQETAGPVGNPTRVRVVLIGVVVLALVAALVIWLLSR
ncbi:MAG TPA: Stp1/IreP family PP2C-type Ser/Thr phosphatase [Gaiellaceae bacterium]|jgi:protein phosphatase|nr:Stp1/IreP family PP2C-type Ser/Thr phosphatase [Gaiellaceae bacterium]